MDFGRRFLKAVHVEEGMEGLTIRAAAALPVAPGTYENDRIVGRRRLASMLRKLCKEQGISPPRGRFSIPTSSLSLKWLDLPRMDPEDLPAAARMQAQRYFGTDPSRSYQTLLPLEAGANSGEVHYLLVAAPRDVVDARAEVMETANIEPVAANIEPMCVLRALYSLFSRGGVFWRNQSLTFVEMGSSATEMYVVRDMRLRFVRSIAFGARNLALTIAEQVGCTEADGAQMLEAPTTSLDTSGKLRMQMDHGREDLDVASTLAPLVREIGRLLVYYRSLFPERSYAGILDRMYLCGGTASLRGMDAYLGAALGITVHVVNPFSQVLAKFNVRAFESVSHREQAFTAAIGLAMADVAKAPEAEGGGADDASEFIWSRAS
ncbi:MAG: pilus assembly protein PilM [Fimbriimonadia bacterium]